MNGTILRHQRHGSAKLVNSTLKIALVTQGQSEITMCQAHPRIQFDRLAQFRLGVHWLSRLEQRIAKILVQQRTLRIKSDASTELFFGFLEITSESTQFAKLAECIGLMPVQFQRCLVGSQSFVSAIFP